MNREAIDLKAEVAELADLLRPLPDARFRTETLFKRWTIDDVLLHLHASDEAGLLSVKDPVAFAQAREASLARRKAGVSLIDDARARFPGLSGRALLARWEARCLELADALAERAPEERLDWFGPPMSAASFAAARLMEVWAHGQAVWDVLGRVRAPTDRLEHIALLGVKTFGWTFRNRGDAPPGPAPRVELTLPSGGVRTWNADNRDDCVAGSVEAFCQVVTQVRNVQDTSLTMHGDVARAWMAHAQCFAGPPHDPPAPGTRHLDAAASAPR